MMIINEVTKTAAKVAAQLDSAIRKHLDDDPKALHLFDAYSNLMDSLAGGTCGGELLVRYEDMVAEDTKNAQRVLAGLDPLPSEQE